KKVDVFEQQNGELVRRKKNDTLQTLRNTLKAGISNSKIISHINVLQEIDEEIWDESGVEVREVLNDISTLASDLSLELSNMADKYNSKSQVDILAFLEQLENISTSLFANNISAEQLENFAQ